MWRSVPLVSISYNSEYLFHGGNTGSNPVGDAMFSIAYGFLDLLSRSLTLHRDTTEADSLVQIQVFARGLEVVSCSRTSPRLAIFSWNGFAEFVKILFRSGPSISEGDQHRSTRPCACAKRYMNKPTPRRPVAVWSAGVSRTDRASQHGDFVCRQVVPSWSA